MGPGFQYVFHCCLSAFLVELASTLGGDFLEPKQSRLLTKDKESTLKVKDRAQFGVGCGGSISGLTIGDVIKMGALIEAQRGP
jgi:hypothetical protein